MYFSLRADESLFISTAHGCFSRKNIVNLVTGLLDERLRNRGSFPGKNKRLFSSPYHPAGFLRPLCHLLVGTWSKAPETWS